jgi:hypothetical protein
VISLIEERLLISAERQKTGHVESRGNVSRGPSGNFQRGVRSPGGRIIKCWECGQTGHVRSRCARRNGGSVNAQRSRNQVVPVWWSFE